MATYTIETERRSKVYEVATSFGNAVFSDTGHLYYAVKEGSTITMRFRYGTRSINVSATLDGNSASNTFHLDTGLSREEVKKGIDNVQRIWAKKAI